MNNDIKEILDKFDIVLKNYELDKKVGNLSVDSIYHLFPNEIITIKNYVTNLQERIISVITYLDMAIEVNEDFLQHYDDEPTILTTEQKRFEKTYILNEINTYKKIRKMLVGGEDNE